MKKYLTVEKVYVIIGIFVITFAAAILLFLLEKPREKIVGGKIVAIVCEKYEGQPSNFNCATGGAISAKDKKYQLLCNDGTSAEVLQKFCHLEIDFEHKH